jgi:hypothetical protein
MRGTYHGKKSTGMGCRWTFWECLEEVSNAFGIEGEIEGVESSESFKYERRGMQRRMIY